MRSGQIVIQPHSVDVVELVRGSVTSAEPRAAKAGIRLSMDLPDALEAHVDSSRIAQVLDNLVSNAIKYSPPDGGDVEVAAWEEQDFVFCRVTDTGMGMNEQEQAEAFTKFFRAGRVRKSAIPVSDWGCPSAKPSLKPTAGPSHWRVSPPARAPLLR